MQKQIDKIIQDSINNGELKSAACIVMHKGKQVYSGSFGYASEVRSVPMNTDTICRLFSLTKPITAAAAMIAMDMGLFTPDTKLSRFFPEYADVRYSTDSKELNGETEVPPITIEHLLNMTAGLPYPGNWCESVIVSGKIYDELTDSRKGGMEWNTQRFAAECSEIPLYNVPGDYWFYGVEADILGAVIEKAADTRYSDFLKKHILGPLGMKDTDFYVPETKSNRLADLYQRTENGLILTECRYLGIEDHISPPQFESGGAGLFSTINDYSKFADTLCHRGSHSNIQLFSEKAFRYMIEPKFNAHLLRSMWDRLSGYNYSCFMRVMTDAEKSHIHSANGEFGWDGWTGTYFCTHPESEITVLYFTQICRASTTEQAENIVNTVFKELL